MRQNPILRCLTQIEAQLLDLGPKQPPVGAQCLGQVLKRQRLDFPSAAGEAFADKSARIFRPILETLDSRGRLRALEQFAQRRGLGEFAAFHHDQRVAREPREQALESIGQPVAGIPHAHDAPPAEHRNRSRLVG